MNIFKKVFSILLGLDFIELILVAVALLSVFKMISGYGNIMTSVVIVMVAVVIAVMVFEILAKVLLIRSASPTFSWASERKIYMAVAKILLVFNLFAIIINVLSIGGEGATVINQLRLYFSIIISVVEMVAILLYLRTAKKLKEEASVTI